MRHLRSARSILASKADSAQRPHFTFVRVLSVILIFASHLMAQSYSDQVHVEPRADFLEGSVDVSLHTNSKPFVSNVDLVLVPVTVSNSMNRVVLGFGQRKLSNFRQ